MQAPLDGPAEQGINNRHEWLVLLTLAGVQFTHILDFMIMMPLGPQLITAFSISDAQFGLLVSAYTFAAGLSGLAAVLYIDKFDRRALLITLYGLFSFATIACGLASSYESLMFARLAAGLFGGVLTALVQTIVADLIPFERRGRAVGVVMTAFSVSSVLGVPLGLYIAALSVWQTPFLLIGALSLLLALTAWRVLPTLDAHLHHPEKMGTRQTFGRVVKEPNHWLGFGFSFSMIFAGFSIIPFITLYMQDNAGVLPEQIPLIYLVGGGATLVSAQLIGRMADRFGKLRTLRVVGLCALVPMSTITITAGLPFWIIIAVSTAFFVFVSGRMIPGMALLSETVDPKIRGTFMTINSSTQSAAMGLAAFMSGLIVGRDAQGLVTYFWVCSLVAISSNLIALWLAGRLKMYSPHAI